MKKNKIIINRMENTIEVSKAFYNKACKYGTPEYEMLTAVTAQNPTFALKFKEVKKKTYTGLTLEQMEKYILTQPDKKKKLEEFETVKTIAEAKGAKYPLTKKWFLTTFEGYKENKDILPDEEKKPEVQETKELKEAA